MLQSINVFVRVRPLVGRESLTGIGECVTVYNDTQLGLDERHFTFDRVFDPSSLQV